MIKVSRVEESDRFEIKNFPLFSRFCSPSAIFFACSHQGRPVFFLKNRKRENGKSKKTGKREIEKNGKAGKKGGKREIFQKNLYIKFFKKNYTFLIILISNQQQRSTKLKSNQYS
jgi:hypothetical protein